MRVLGTLDQMEKYFHSIAGLTKLSGCNGLYSKIQHRDGCGRNYMSHVSLVSCCKSNDTI